MRNNQYSWVKWVFVCLLLLWSGRLQAQPAGLIGYWRLDEGSGTVATDASGLGTSGTLSGGATWTTGKSGSALSLDGRSGSVRLSMPNATLGRTRAAWIYATSTTGYRGIVSNNDWVSGSLHFKIDSGRLSAGINGGATIYAPITSGAWHHVATTYDKASGALRIYIDGKEAAASMTTAGLTVQGEDFIGNEYTDGRYFQGTIDDVQIYDRALTATEIQSIYSVLSGTIVSPTPAPAPAPTPAPTTPTGGEAGYWSLDEGTGTTAADGSGLGHPGTLTGGATWTTGKFGSALALDGKSGYVKIAMPNATVGRTRAAWIYVTSTSGTHGIISNSDWVSGSLHFKVEGSLVLAGINGGATLNAPITANTWHHVATTYDKASGALRIYIDGKEAAASMTTAGLTVQGEDFIGNEYTDGRYFQGTIDDVRIFDRALSASEIAALYGSQSSSPTTPAPNQVPLVQIDAPTAGQSFTAPAQVTIDVTASDSDGAVARVEFFNGSTLLGTDTASPYSYTWSNVAAGSYSVKARATDNAGATSETSVNITVASAPAPIAPSTGEAAYWKLDDGSGTVATDASGFNHPGTLTGSATWTSGKSGSAVALDGKSGYIRLSMPNATVGRTRAAWIYVTSTSTTQGVISNNDWVSGSLHFKIDAGKLVAGINGGATISAPISGNAWHHVATTYDKASGAFRIFIDGKEAAASMTAAGLTVQGEDYIGNEYTDGRYFQGTIDDVRIYDRALSASEIAALYGGSGSGTSEPAPAPAPPPAPAPAPTPTDAIFASPTGSSGADGSSTKPYTLVQALSAISSSGKNVIMLKAGVYPGPHNYKQVFSTSNPITIRPEPGASAKIDGSFYRSGGGIRWQNIEFGVTNWTTRTSSQKGSAPTDMPDNDFNVLAQDQFINCIVHDHNSNGFWSPAQDVLVYGTLFYNQGWQGADRGHGHAAYMQNEVGTKQFKRNVFVSGFSGYTVHAYSEKGSLQGFNYEENVSISGRWHIGGYVPVSRVTMTRNHIYGGTRLGYSNDFTNYDATLKDNVLREAVTVWGNWSALTQTGTTMAAGLNRVYVYDNAYDADRGMVVIYNAANASAVSVNLSSLPLTVGKKYKLLNSLNPAQAYEFTYSGASISVPMTGWSVALPVNWSSPVVENTFPSFGTFLLVASDGSGAGLYRSASSVGGELIASTLPTDVKFELGESYPNPFSSIATVPFSLPEDADVQIHVYDLLGRRVSTLAQSHYVAGQHQVTFEAGNLPSGMYLIQARIETASKKVYSFTRKVTLVK